MSPSITPTHRAVFSERHLIVVPYRPGLWPDADRPATAERPAFDLWSEPDRVLVRQHGTYEASAAIDRLAQWAREEAHADLEVGPPLCCV